MHKFHLLLGSIAASTATLVAVVVLHDPYPAPSDPFEGLHLSAPAISDADLEDDEILNSPVVSYQSDTFGYLLKYPGNWELDDSRTEFDGDILSDPSQRVIITISETKDASLMTEEGQTAMRQSIEQSLRLDPAFKLEAFEHLTWKKMPTIFTDGVRRIGGKQYHTREYNIFRKKHNGVLNISITTQQDAEALYEQALKDILQSLNVCPHSRGQ